MFSLSFHPDIAIEVKESFDWYENQSEGLGDDFLNELEFAYQSITELPNTWPIFNNNYRRFLLAKFPYSIIYREKGSSIFVVAIMHNSRKPSYWIERKNA